MLNERWETILDKITSNFDVVKHEKELVENGEDEIIIFNGPLGKIKLVRSIRPLVIDKKTIGAHRRGKSQAQYEYTYSDTEKVSKLKTFKEVDGEWEEMSGADFL